MLEPVQALALFLPQERDDSERKQRSRLSRVFSPVHAPGKPSLTGLHPALEAWRPDRSRGHRNVLNHFIQWHKAN